MYSINFLKSANFKVRLVYWIILSSIGIVFEALFRDYLYNHGIQIIKILQDLIEDNDFLIFLSQLVSIAGSKYAIYMGILFIFNYEDIHCSIVVTLIAGLAGVGTGFLKLIYRNPRPYFHEEWIKVYDCETGYGNPSGHAIVATSLYLSFSKIIHIKWKYSQTYQKVKHLIKYLFYILIISVAISRMALGSHSLNQIMLGSFLGYQIYSFFFYLCKMHLKAKEIKVIIKNSTSEWVFILVFFVMLISYIIFNFLIQINEMDDWMHIINISCPNTPYSKILDFEAYFMVSSCYSIIGMHLGIHFDINYNLKNNIKNWTLINFGRSIQIDKPINSNYTDCSSDRTSGNSEIDKKENMIECINCLKNQCYCQNFDRWNKTNFLKSLLRILVIIMSIIVPFLMNVFISDYSSINIIFILKNAIPYAMINFILFAFTRRICVRLGVANDIELDFLFNKNKVK